jgi:Sec-independent protein translocase protein TatA
MMGLFGLGTAEVVIILAAGAFIIGPEQLGKMVGSLKSDLPDDIKKIPEEFQKGLEESTENSRARNAKPMEPPPDEDVDEK